MLSNECAYLLDHPLWVGAEDEVIRAGDFYHTSRWQRTAQSDSRRIYLVLHRHREDSGAGLLCRIHAGQVGEHVFSITHGCVNG